MKCVDAKCRWFEPLSEDGKRGECPGALPPHRYYEEEECYLHQVVRVMRDEIRKLRKEKLNLAMFAIMKDIL